jgi:hypothetical protein
MMFVGASAAVLTDFDGVILPSVELWDARFSTGVRSLSPRCRCGRCALASKGRKEEGGNVEGVNAAACSQSSRLTACS